MLTLAIDTAGAACSIALVDGAQIIAERHEIVGRGHAERLIPWIAGLPDSGRADRIVVGCGPGSFTGVRIGIAAARGLGLGWGVPVHGICSLMLTAASCAAEKFVLAVEGGHGELLVQSFRNNPLRADAPFVSLPPEHAAVLMRADAVAGDAAARLIAARGYGTEYRSESRAAHITLLPHGAASLVARPVYGRAPDAKPMGE